MRKLLAAVFLTFGLAVLPSSAFADDDAVEQSDAHFQAGAARYHEGKYSEAILEFRRGYDIAPHPIFQVNIALAYAKLQNWNEAAEWAFRASRDPNFDGDQAITTEGRARAWSTAATASNTAQTPPVEVEPPVVAVAAAEPDGDYESRTTGLRLTGYVVGGIGVAAVGGAGIVGAMLQDEKREFEAAGEAGDAASFERLRGEIDRGQSVGRVLLFAGAGLVGVGVVLWAVGGPSDATAFLGIGPGSAVLTWRY